jgi:glycerate dehydrogenase
MKQIEDRQKSKHCKNRCANGKEMQMDKMKIVFLDAKTIGEDIDLSGYDALGEVVKYGFSTAEEARMRTKDADVVVVNKVGINETSIGEAEHLKLVCVTATGTNNLDKEYLERKGIAWRNVAGYSTETVAQHTFALLFYLLEKMHYYDEYVKSERYVADTTFTHFANVFHELNGKTWGIVGLGAIGRRVADIAGMFGCHVIYYSTSGKNNQPGYERVDFDTLLTESDIISVHAPLDANTEGLMNRAAFAKMKPTAFFLNLGRGPIVVEADLADAIENGKIAGAGLDVLCVEPMSADNPLRRIKDSDRLIITPHIAWASVEARTRLMKIIEQQIREFFS